MEFDLDVTSDEGIEALETACSRVDGSHVTVNDDGVVLFCDREDAVWNVWRELQQLEESAKTERATEKSREIYETIEDIMSQ